jgi:hypothetical protein
VLRATTVFRQEDGEWKVVHRHGDGIAAEDAAVVSALAAARVHATNGTDQPEQ